MELEDAATILRGTALRLLRAKQPSIYDESAAPPGGPIEIKVTHAHVRPVVRVRVVGTRGSLERHGGHSVRLLSANPSETAQPGRVVAGPGTMDSSPPSERVTAEQQQRSCQVPGCDFTLEKSTASAYCWRYRLCPTHLNASEVQLEGQRPPW